MLLSRGTRSRAAVLVGIALPSLILVMDIALPAGAGHGPSVNPNAAEMITTSYPSGSVSTSTTTSALTSSCLPSSVAVGLPITCRATVVGSYPSGEITWSSSGLGRFSAGSCKLSKGSCYVKYTPTSAATPIDITASYGGNTRDPPSAETFSITVTQRASTMTLACSASSMSVGSQKMVKCTTHVKGYYPTGTVAWSQFGVGSLALTSSVCVLAVRSCSIKMTGATPGVVTIQAAYGGDQNNFGGSSSCKVLTVKYGGSMTSSSSTTITATTTTTLGNNNGGCGTRVAISLTSTAAMTTTSAVGSITSTAAWSTTTASAITSAVSAGQATVVVTPEFEDNPGSTQQVSVFIDGKDVGFATSSTPWVSTVSPGTHTASCSDVNGYMPLGLATFSIAADQEVLVTCLYVPITQLVTTTNTATLTATTSSATTTASEATTTTSTTSLTTSTTYVSTTYTSAPTSSVVNGIPDPSIYNGTANIWYPPDSSALVSYALGLIDNDREANGLPPLSLSVIPSGQQHADSMDYFGYFSHTDPQGYGPYQRYTMLGGSGPMGENIGFAYCTNSPPNSTELAVQPCSLTTVESAVAVLEWSMMNNDLQCCNNGHRDNILNPQFTKVSIGIAYNDVTGAVFFVEDFGDV